MRNFLSLIFVLVIPVSQCLFSMSAPDMMPPPPDASAMGDTAAPPVMPPPPDASAMGTTAAPPVIPPPPDASAMGSMAAPTAPDVPVVPEQLGEFEVKEDQAGLVQKPDVAIINQVKKSNEISKQMKDVADDIAKIRDDVLAKSALINNKLDDLYQKVGLESGKIKELLTEEK